MILPINQVAYWIYIHQRKQAKIEKYFIRKNSTIIDHGCRVGCQDMLRNKAAYKYKTPLKCPYEFFQVWTNRSVILQTRSFRTRINIHCIKPYNNPDAERYKHKYIHVTKKYNPTYIHILTYTLSLR